MPENLPKSPRHITLNQLQKWLLWMVVDPRGIKGALADPQSLHISQSNHRFKSRYLEPRPSCLNLIESKNHVSAATRLSVYAEGYFIRIKEFIEGAFPQTSRLLGKNLKSNVIEFLKRHPSHCESLANLAEPFCEFIKKHHTSGIASLAHYELLLHQSHFRAHVTPTAPTNPQSDLRLRIHRAPYFYKTFWNVKSVCQKKTCALKRLKTEQALVIYRFEGQVLVIRVPSFIKGVSKQNQLGKWLGIREFTSKIIQLEHARATPASIKSYFKHWSEIGLIEFDLSS